MKNIWIFNHYAAPPKHIGLTRHYDIARELVSQGNQVTIFCSSFIHYKYYSVITDNSTYLEETVEGVKFVYLRTPSYSGNGIRRILNMPFFAAKLAINSLSYAKRYGKPDTIYSSTPHLLVPAIGCIVAKLLKVRNVTEVRDLWPETFIQFGRLKHNSIPAYLLRLIEKTCYRQSDVVVTTLPGAVDYIARCGLVREKICYINNGVDVALFDTNANLYNFNEVIDLSACGGKFIVAYTGAHGVANNLDLLLDLAKLCLNSIYADKIDFILVGAGAEKAKLQTRAQQEQITNVHFFNSVDKKYIPSLLSHVDCSILLLRDCPLYKKFGISLNKIFDYLASSTPILMLGDPYNDIVSESKSGISVPQLDNSYLTALRDSLFSLYEMSQDERDRLGHNGRAYVERNHDISVITKKIKKILF